MTEQQREDLQNLAIHDLLRLRVDYQVRCENTTSKRYVKHLEYLTEIEACIADYEMLANAKAEAQAQKEQEQKRIHDALQDRVQNPVIMTDSATFTALDATSFGAVPLLDIDFDGDGMDIPILLQKSKSLATKIARGDDVVYNSSLLYNVNNELGKRHRSRRNSLRHNGKTLAKCPKFEPQKSIQVPVLTDKKEQEIFIARALREQAEIMGNRQIQATAYEEKSLVFQWLKAVEFYRQQGLSRKLAKKFASQGQKDFNDIIKRADKRAEKLRKLLSGAYEGKILGYVHLSDNRRKPKALGSLQSTDIDFYAVQKPSAVPLSDKGAKERASVARKEASQARKQAKQAQKVQEQPQKVQTITRKRSA